MTFYPDMMRTQVARLRDQAQSPLPSILVLREIADLLLHAIGMVERDLKDAGTASFMDQMIKLDLKAGQTLAVILTVENPSYPILEAAKDFISSRVPEGVNVLLFPKGTRLPGQDGIDYQDLLRRYIAYVADSDIEAQGDGLAPWSAWGHHDQPRPFPKNEMDAMLRLAGRDPETGEASA